MSKRTLNTSSKKKVLLFLGCFGFAFIFLRGQTSSEVVVGIGGITYSGDLTPSPFAANEINFNLTISYNYFLSRKFALEARAELSRLTGDLRNARTRYDEQKELFQNSGYLKFDATPFSVSFLVTWYPLGGPRFNSNGLFINRSTPFLSFGAGIMTADANITINGGATVLPPFPEPNDVSTFFIIPIKTGFRYDLSEKFSIVNSIGWTAVLSDYLDGVSQNLEPSSRDSLFSFSFGLIIHLL